jgi:hypothetical protein
MIDFSPDFMYLLKRTEDDVGSALIESPKTTEPLETKVAAAVVERVEAVPQSVQIPERKVKHCKKPGFKTYYTIVTDNSALVTLWFRDFPPSELRRDGSRWYDESYSVAHRSVIKDAGVCLKYDKGDLYLQTSFLATKKGYSAVSEFLERTGDGIVSLQGSTSVMLNGHNFDLRVRGGKNLILVEVDPGLFPIRLDEVAREKMNLPNGKSKFVWKFKTANRRAEMYDALKSSYEAASEVLTEPL